MAAMIIVILVVLATTPLAAAATTGNNTDTTSEAYQVNVELLIAGLQKNASSTPFLYAKGSVGVGPDKAYGLALCRGDIIDASFCSACIQDAFKALRPYRHDTSFNSESPQCYIVLSGVNFLEYGDLSGTDALYMALVNTQNFTAPLIPGWDPSNAESVSFRTGLIKVMLYETAELAASPSTTRRYATGRTIVTSSFPAIYCLVQCTPDLTPTECVECLNNISKTATRMFEGRSGAQLYSIWCNLRYEAYKFYRGEPMKDTDLSGVAEPPPQGLPPSGVVNQKPNAKNILDFRIILV